MSWRPRVLLVAPTPVLAKNLFAWLTDGGYDVALVATFSAAKVQLQSRPHLLISEIRLGEYNGLHLASRAQSDNVPSVVIGESDPVLQRDAQQMGVTYMTSDIDREYLLVLAEHLTEEARQRRRDANETNNLAATTGSVLVHSRAVADNLAFVSSAELAPVKAPRSGRRFN